MAGSITEPDVEFAIFQGLEARQLRSLAKGNTPTGVISLKLQRPPTAIRSKAQREGISLKPGNRSPYNRRKGTR